MERRRRSLNGNYLNVSSRNKSFTTAGKFLDFKWIGMRVDGDSIIDSARLVSYKYVYYNGEQRQSYYRVSCALSIILDFLCLGW